MVKSEILRTFVTLIMKKKSNEIEAATRKPGKTGATGIIKKTDTAERPVRTGKDRGDGDHPGNGDQWDVLCVRQVQIIKLTTNKLSNTATAKSGTKSSKRRAETRTGHPGDE